MIRVGIVGLGKMGLSHLSIFRAHPQVELAGICDSTGYLLSVLGKYTGVKTYANLDAMLAAEELDAVVIATPSALHATMVRTALERGLHVFCEKPFCLDPVESAELANSPASAGWSPRLAITTVSSARSVRSSACLMPGPSEPSTWLWPRPMVQWC